MRSLNLIVIHCSATANGKSLVGNGGIAGVIDSWHGTRGFRRAAPAVAAFNPALKHIGYHYVIGVDGTVHTGRAHDEVGAHAINANANSLGICMLGTDAFTPNQWTALLNLVTGLCAKYKIPFAPAQRVRGLQLSGICGHRDTSPDKNANGVIEQFEWLKICPGFDVAQWIKQLAPAAKNVVSA